MNDSFDLNKEMEKLRKTVEWARVDTGVYQAARDLHEQRGNKTEVDLSLYENAKGNFKYIKIEPHEKQESTRKSNGRLQKLKTIKLIFLFLAAMSMGILGFNAAVNDIPMKIAARVEYHQIHNDLSNLEGDFLRTQIGDFKQLQIAQPESGKLKDALADPRNISISEDGTKTGAVIDYYEAFDNYLKEKTGMGYYERVLEQEQIKELLGKEADGNAIFTREELEALASKDKGMGL